ncbi:MAG: uroporphyrinogen-III synthase [Nitrospira sp.]|nr:MAG: uroporphyrinogen-III synthase [Nitrospira sp.]
MATVGFNGLTVVTFESRMAVEIARLIERHGGVPLVTPALREIPLDDNSAALKFGVQLTTERVDMLILLTGVGTTAMFDLLKTRYPWSSIVAALKQTALVARGPKPVAALKALGLQPTLTVPEPNTWIEVVSTLDEYRPVKGLRVAVQEYGASNPDLLEALKQRGGDVFQVPIYRWALPKDLGPLRQSLSTIIAGKAPVLLITNAAQVDHVMQVLGKDGNVEPFRAALKKMVVASIGPTASERLRHHEWPIDLEPSHPKMGVLVKECAEQVHTLRQSKNT